jgi:hypothetical protein
MTNARVMAIIARAWSPWGYAQSMQHAGHASVYALTLSKPCMRSPELNYSSSSLQCAAWRGRHAHGSVSVPADGDATHAQPHTTARARIRGGHYGPRLCTPMATLCHPGEPDEESSTNSDASVVCVRTSRPCVHWSRRQPRQNHAMGGPSPCL